MPMIRPQKSTQRVKKTAAEASRPRAVAASGKANKKVASTPSTMIPEWRVKYLLPRSFGQFLMNVEDVAAVLRGVALIHCPAQFDDGAVFK